MTTYLEEKSNKMFICLAQMWLALQRVLRNICVWGKEKHQENRNGEFMKSRIQQASFCFPDQVWVLHLELKQEGVTWWLQLTV